MQEGKQQNWPKITVFARFLYRQQTERNNIIESKTTKRGVAMLNHAKGIRFLVLCFTMILACGAVAVSAAEPVVYADGVGGRRRHAGAAHRLHGGLYRGTVGREERRAPAG